MNLIKRKISIVVFTVLTTFGYSNNGKEYNNIVNSKKVKVEFKNVKRGHILTLKDENHLKLHSEPVEKKGDLTKVFDLSFLKDGNYTIELNKDFEIVVKHFQLKDRKVIFNNDAEKVIFKPVIRNNKNILMVSKIAFDNVASKVLLYYNNQVIHKETIKSSSVLKRTYKLDKEKKGNYTVVIYDNGRRYINNFSL